MFDQRNMTNQSTKQKHFLFKIEIEASNADFH